MTLLTSAPVKEVIVSRSRVIVKRSIKKRLIRGKRINQTCRVLYMELTFNHLLRAFSNVEASFQCRDLFVPKGCWERKTKAGGELGVCMGQKKERKTCDEAVSSFSSFLSRSLSGKLIPPLIQQGHLQRGSAEVVLGMKKYLLCDGFSVRISEGVKAE